MRMVKYLDGLWQGLLNADLIASASLSSSPTGDCRHDPPAQANGFGAAHGSTTFSIDDALSLSIETSKAPQSQYVREYVSVDAWKVVRAAPAIVFP